MTAQQDGVIFPVAWGGRKAIGPDVDTLIAQLDTEQRAHAAALTDAAVANVRKLDYRLAYINESRNARVREARLLRIIGALVLLLVAALIVAAFGWLGGRSPMPRWRTSGSWITAWPTSTSRAMRGCGRSGSCRSSGR